MTDLDDDNIIELTDIAKKDFDLSTDDDVIELTDVAEDETINLDLDIEKEDKSELDISDSEDAEQIDDGFTDDFFEEDDDFTDDDQVDDVVNIMTDEPKSEPELDKVAPDDFNIDQEQIEAILERIIEKKFAGKIESILFEVMEKVIEKQIVEIKENLQKDLE